MANLKQNLINSLLVEFLILAVVSIGSVGVVLVAFGNDVKSIIPVTLAAFWLVEAIFLIGKMRRFNELYKKKKEKDPSTESITSVWVISWFVLVVAGVLAYWANPLLIDYFTGNEKIFRLLIYLIFAVGLVWSLYLNLKHRQQSRK